jgi:hypothetical protein
MALAPSSGNGNQGQLTRELKKLRDEYKVEMLRHQETSQVVLTAMERNVFESCLPRRYTISRRATKRW